MARQIHKIWTVPKLAHPIAGVKPANAPSGDRLKLFRSANQTVVHARRLFTSYRFPGSGSPLNQPNPTKLTILYPRFGLATPGGDFRILYMEWRLRFLDRKVAGWWLLDEESNPSRIIRALGRF
jgi:hypothetical protein